MKLKEASLKMMEKVNRERQEGKEIYPPDNLIYRATPPDKVKVCIVREPFRGSKPFSTANKLLIEMGGEPIEWKI